MNISNRTETVYPEIRMGIASIIGGRSAQQDSASWYSGPEGVMALVCDGMGGMDDGGKASRCAVDDLTEAFISRDKDIPMPEFFKTSAHRINDKIKSFKTMTGKRMNSGTTCVCVTYQNGHAYWLSVGDSRIYLLRGHKMAQVNREHNYRERLKEMLQNGEISQQQYNAEEKTRKAEALTSFLGIRNLQLMERNQKPYPLQSGDIFLLCSDGLYKSLTNDQIMAMILDNDVDLNIAADRLCQMAHRYGGSAQDNTTVLLFQYLPKNAQGERR